MAQQPRGVDPFADLTKKIAILEREMATQRLALERLKALGQAPRPHRSPAQEIQVRRTA